MTTTINPYLRLLYYYDIDSKVIILQKKKNGMKTFAPIQRI